MVDSNDPVETPVVHASRNTVENLHIEELFI